MEIYGFDRNWVGHQFNRVVVGSVSERCRFCLACIKSHNLLHMFWYDKKYVAINLGINIFFEMARKKCPKCQQTLPVACKSCPCGHIFLAKKHSTSKDADVKRTNMSVSVKRLRPERPKREIPDYEYRDNYTRISVGNGDSQFKTISKKMKLFDYDDYGDDEDDGTTVDGKGYNRSDSVESQTGLVKRKRGRPKGSKNKPKDDQIFMADLSEDNEDPFDTNQAPGLRKAGKPKRPHEKVYQLPPVPEDKVMIYSLILSDINERFVSQNRIKCLPGL